MIRSLPVLALSALCASAPPAVAQRAATGNPVQSAPIADVRYTITYDRGTAPSRMIRVAMSFTPQGSDPVLLSLPAWTPGAYEISNFSHWVVDFSAAGDGKSLVWDKLDYDTWRVRPGGARSVTVTLDYVADTLDNAMAWSTPDFVLFNGTNVFLYAEGQSFDFASQVVVKTDAAWRVATGMRPGAAPRTFTSSNYHDLVDMPFFVGRFDIDSTRVANHWVRFASYPGGLIPASGRQQVLSQVAKMIPPEAAVFGEIPFDSYTIFQIADSTYGGLSGLEHQNSHVDIVTALAIGTPYTTSLYSHEIFHAWNVKRLRPADLWPYRYDGPQPSPWLWMSEGITDYYADLALVRGGLTDSAGFFETTSGKINEVAAARPVALEDASVSTWVHPADGTGYLYYPKGSLAGFMLDILIRDGSDNRGSLDSVMRDLYHTAYKAGKGFTDDQFWGAVSRAAAGRSFADFYARYVDGREPYPWTTVLPLAGMRLQADTMRQPRLGVASQPDSSGVRVSSVEPGGAAAEAGLLEGDYLLEVGGVPVTDQEFGTRFRARYGTATEGSAIPIRVRRGGQVLNLSGKLRFAMQVQSRIAADARASGKALRIRNGILKGTVDR
jgi:predicted metalloprotease with PDZ domain